MLGTGIMAGSLVALDSLTAKDGSGADSEWLKSLMVDKVLSMRFRDIGIVAGMVGIGLIIISVCGACLKKNCKNDQKEGEWMWEPSSKVEGERKSKDEEEVKETEKGDDIEMEETAV